MGMYSEVINSCDALNRDLVGYLQTKDFESILDLYWIAKDGALYRIYWPAERIITVSGSPFQPGSFPSRGSVRPFRFTGCISVIGGSSDGAKSTCGLLCFDEGRLFVAATGLDKNGIVPYRS